MLLKFNNFSIPKEAIILFVLIFIIAIAFPSWANAIFASIVVASIFGIMVAVNSATSQRSSFDSAESSQQKGTTTNVTTTNITALDSSPKSKSVIEASFTDDISGLAPSPDNLIPPELRGDAEDSGPNNDNYDVDAKNKTELGSNAYYNPNGFKWMEDESYTNCYEPPSYDIENCNLYSYLPFDEANARMASLRQRDKKCTDGWVTKNANYYKKHFGRELAEEEAKRWWGNQEY